MEYKIKHKSGLWLKSITYSFSDWTNKIDSAMVIINDYDYAFNLSLMYEADVIEDCGCV